MKNRGQELFFHLIASAVSGCPLSAEEGALYDSAMLLEMTALARYHDLTHLLALGLRNNGLLTLENGELEKEIFHAAFRFEQLNYELTSICRTLERAQVPFIPLKGSVLRQYYPEPWMRTSCDIDVLVHEEDLDGATSALADALNYRIGEKSAHDIQIFTPSGQHIELHFNLIEDHRIKGASAILNRVWDAAVPCGGWTYQYEMPDELFYFYHIAHMAKHIENGGCGIRPFLDIWVLMHYVPHDRDRREQLLADGGLSVFAGQAERLAEIWFGTGMHDDTTRCLEQYILSGGVYGNLVNQISVQQIKQGGRLRYACSQIWLPYEALKWAYPSLERKPQLLALYELRRWGRLLFIDGIGRGLSKLRLNSSISNECTANVRELLSALGLAEEDNQISKGAI